MMPNMNPRLTTPAAVLAAPLWLTVLLCAGLLTACVERVNPELRLDPRLASLAQDWSLAGSFGGDAQLEVDSPDPWQQRFEPGGFKRVAGVLAENGEVWVCDLGISRLQVFDPSGKFLEQWTDFPSKPRGSMYITPDDTLYVSHVDSESITIMKNGKVLERVTGVGGRPHGVTIDSQGNIYVANPASRSVKKIVKKSVLP